MEPEITNDECDNLHLSVEAEQTAPLQYYTYRGQPKLIPKIFKLKYNDLLWDADEKIFLPQEKEKEIDNLTAININAPLTNTVFSLTGDAFAEHFGIGQNLTTDEYNAIALKVYSDTVVVKKQGESEQDEGGDRLSAPVEITFNAYANEPVAGMYIWTIQKKSGATLLRYTGKSVTYTFEESGDFTATLEVIGVGSVCNNDVESYDIHIGSSDLQLPNAFSPGSSFGSNDIYRVSYKSLTSFKASIYNRWGNLLFHWEDPAQGWDGRVNGRFVPAGVYFIVVEATGADGKKYSQSSDINILRKK
jgi:gliding motility-associated-like protein